MKVVPTKHHTGKSSCASALATLKRESRDENVKALNAWVQFHTFTSTPEESKHPQINLKPASNPSPITFFPTPRDQQYEVLIVGSTC